MASGFSSIRREGTTERPANNNRTSSEPFSHFSEFVDRQRTRYIAKDASENNLSYVPLPELRDYWTPARLSNVQRAYKEPLSFDISNIRNHYLRTFSTLVYCGRATDLHVFTRFRLDDDSLPLRSCSGSWPKDPYYEKLFEDINQHQWTFFPLVFAPRDLEDRRLEDSRIIPIDELDHIKHGAAAIIQKMVINDSCNNMLEKTGSSTPGLPSQRMFVLKTYHHSKYEKLYTNEVKALLLLRNSPSPNVITYYGSYQHLGSYNLIFEYANGGDLGEFFRNTAPPKGADVCQFWSSLSQVHNGLYRIHNLLWAGDNKHVNGIHEDIKPANILLFRSPGRSPYDFTPKVADFGLFSHVRESRTNSSEAMGLDNYGDQLYSSPECSHNARSTADGPNFINAYADIFSMGAVLSNACAWVKGGFDEQTRYLHSRAAYHRRLRTFNKSGYEGCYHDGIDRLAVVDETHKSIRDWCEANGDNVTPKVIDVIETDMLLSRAGERRKAKQLMERFEQILKPALTSPSTASTRTNANSQGTTPPTELLLREMTLAELGKMIETQQASTPTRWRSRDRATMDGADDLIKSLKVDIPDRDHFVFVDDSTSMVQHLETVKMAILALLYVAKQLDPNKLELAFASNPKKVHRTSRTKKLARLIVEHRYQRDPTLMAHCLGRLIDCFILKHLPIRKLGINLNPLARKPISIYVFTDGNWAGEEGAESGAERPLKRLIAELRRRRLDKNHVTFHIVRLSDEENGRRHLDRLDRFGRSWSWDIVDVKTVRDPVRDIFLGPISEANDDRGEN